MKKSEKQPSKDSGLELQLPDWSGMDDSSQRISVEAAFALTFEYPRLFPEQYAKWLENRPPKCLVEFVLD